MNQGYHKLGELLVAHYAITEAELSAALEQQSLTNQRLGEILVELGYVDEEHIAKCLADQYGYELLNPAELKPMQAALECLEPDQASHHLVLPLSIDDAELFCVVADPLNIPITDDLRQKHRRHVRVAVAPASALLTAIRLNYHLAGPQSRGNMQTSLPPRYINAFPRAEYGNVLILEATDSHLERPVTLFRISVDSEEKQVHLDLVKRNAKSNFDRLYRIYDSFPYEKFRWTVFEPIPGETLASSLRFKGRKNPSSAADIVRRTAEAAELLGGNWVCPENIWVNGNAVTFAPVVPPSDGYAFCDPVEALGQLLWHCLLGKFDGNYDFDRGTALSIPSGMIMILQRCLTTRREERFASAAEVGRALGSFHWITTDHESKKAAAEDREALLASLRVVTPTKRPSFWDRLFGRSAA